MSKIRGKIIEIGERFERYNFDPMLHSRGRTYIEIYQAKSFLNTALLELLEVATAEERLRAFEILHKHAMKTETTHVLDLIESAQKEILSDIKQVLTGEIK